MVYEILSDNDLCQFYEIEEKPGISLKGKKQEQYAYLDDSDVVEKLVYFQNDKMTRAGFYLPQIHCASCIWLLENLYRLNESILSSKVNFLKKEAYITFDLKGTSFRKIVELLASIGYAPAFNLGSLETSGKKEPHKRFYYQLSVAGFAFGNIMLLSLPEYFGLAESSFRELFGYLNILLILPVVSYSGVDYLRSAWKGLGRRQLNIDVPIALGILTLFGRSLFEIISHTGAGYLDSLAGLVFFLLIGKWFQQVTYHQLSFERDYKSYFPVAVTLLKKGKEQNIPLNRLNAGDRIIIRNGELIPTDGILLKGEAWIDYSFVTGENAPIHEKTGNKVYAGGRQKGAAIEVSVTKKTDQSYLTQLWNEAVFKEESFSGATKLADRVGRYFTMVILSIALLTLTYWIPKDVPLAINAFTAVLIIACPCAVALSIPFTFGNTLRLLGRKGFYLKNTRVIEQLNEIGSLVLDKTGTITHSANGTLHYEGEQLTSKETQAVQQLAMQSLHPVSRQIVQSLKKSASFTQINQSIASRVILKDFKEITGQGIQGTVGEIYVEIKKSTDEKGTALSINGQQKGIFKSRNQYREGLEVLLKNWARQFKVYLLSGDNDMERSFLEKFFPRNNLYFEQSPKEKLNFVQQRQLSGEKILMLGDGLNDAGALRQADIGIVIAENINNFTPACDAILDARRFHRLPDFMRFARFSLWVVYAAYGLAFVYNIIGLSFAVQGTLSPVIAAILMPLSSITIVAFGVGMTYLISRTIIK